jgi:hypothetical protein
MFIYTDFAIRLQVEDSELNTNKSWQFNTFLVFVMNII